jgi:hypothetical protein
VGDHRRQAGQGRRWQRRPRWRVAARRVAQAEEPRRARHAVVALEVVVDADLGGDPRDDAVAGELPERVEGVEVVGLVDRGDEPAILDDQRHALEAEGLLGREELDRGALGPLEHRAGGDRDAQLEAEVHRQGVEVDRAHLEQDRAEPTADLLLELDGGRDLGLGQATVSDQHLPELHRRGAYHGHPARARQPSAPAERCATTRGCVALSRSC